MPEDKTCAREGCERSADEGILLQNTESYHPFTQMGETDCMHIECYIQTCNEASGHIS